MLQLPASGFEPNTGLREALRGQGMDPRMVNHIDDIMLINGISARSGDNIT